MRSEEWIFSTASRRITFAGALGVVDVHPEEGLHRAVEDRGWRSAAGWFVRLVQHRARQPPRADDAVGLVNAARQFMEGVRWGGAVGVHVADGVGQRGEL